MRHARRRQPHRRDGRVLRQRRRGLLLRQLRAVLPVRGPERRHPDAVPVRPGRGLEQRVVQQERDVDGDRLRHGPAHVGRRQRRRHRRQLRQPDFERRRLDLEPHRLPRRGGRSQARVRQRHHPRPDDRGPALLGHCLWRLPTVDTILDKV